MVESTNFNGKMWLDSVGNFYSEHARITERVRLADATIDYEVTIDDPTSFTRPWKLNAPLRRAGTAGGGNANDTDPYAAESWEHACHEGNFNHIHGGQVLGFKWYPGAKPPAR